MVSEPVLFERSHQLLCNCVRKIIHLATNIFGSTHRNHTPAEFVISFQSIVDTLVGDEIFLVSWLLTVSVSMRSSFLYDVVRNGKEVHRVLDEFLFSSLP